MPHVDQGQLHALLDGAFDEREARTLHGHIAACADCYARLLKERSLRDRSIAILDSVQPVRLNPPPFEAVLQRAQQPKPAATQYRMSAPARLAWAATVILALGMGWLARDFPARRAAPVSVERVEGPTRAPRQVMASPAAPPPASVSALPEPSAQRSSQQGESVASTGQLADRIGEAGTPRDDARAPDRVESRADVAKKTASTDVAATQNQATQSVDALQIQAKAVADGRSAIVRQENRAAEGARPAAPVASFMRAGGAALPEWRYVTVEQAQQMTGRTIVLVPGLEVVNIGLAALGNSFMVRATQRLPDGGLLELLQQPIAVPAAVEQVRTGSTGDQERNAISDGMGGWLLTISTRELLLTARATVTPDSLRALLLRAR